MSDSPSALRSAAARLRSHAGELECAAGSLRLVGATPPGWTIYEDAGECALAVVRDEPHPVFGPNLTIAVERHELVRDADAWVDAQVDGLAQNLTSMQLIDRGAGCPRRDGAGVPLEEDAGRSVAHLRAVSASLRRRWSVDVSWVAKRGAVDGRSLEVIDSDAGLVIVWDDGDAVVLHPVSPTEAWVALTQLVPEEHEADLDATLAEEASRP